MSDSRVGSEKIRPVSASEGGHLNLLQDFSATKWYCGCVHTCMCVYELDKVNVDACE